MNRRLAWSLSAFTALGLGTWLTTPAALRFEPPDYGAVLPAAEDNPGIIPGTGQRLTWHDPQQPGRTEWSVVYLHGFSATRAETAPLSALVAESLGANLFEVRLSGHGLRQNPLAGVTAEDWLDDTAQGTRCRCRPRRSDSRHCHQHRRNTGNRVARSPAHGIGRQSCAPGTELRAAGQLSAACHRTSRQIAHAPVCRQDAYLEAAKRITGPILVDQLPFCGPDRKWFVVMDRADIRLALPSTQRWLMFFLGTGRDRCTPMPSGALSIR